MEPLKLIGPSRETINHLRLAQEGLENATRAVDRVLFWNIGDYLSSPTNWGLDDE